MSLRQGDGVDAWFEAFLEAFCPCQGRAQRLLSTFFHAKDQKVRSQALQDVRQGQTDSPHARLPAFAVCEKHEVKASCNQGQARRSRQGSAPQALSPLRPLTQHAEKYNHAWKVILSRPSGDKTKRKYQHGSFNKRPGFPPSSQESTEVRQGLLRQQIEALPLRQGGCPACLAVCLP